MKHRAISFITALAMCLSLCPVWVPAAEGAVPDPEELYEAVGPTTHTETFDVTNSLLFDTAGYTYTVKGYTAMRVEGTGKLYLTNGTIESTNGAGIEVLSGGFLRVNQSDMKVIGTTCGLNISSGTTVELSGGTFTGGTAAIQAADYGALLVSGYSFFDGNGKQLTPDEVSGLKTVSVKGCANHEYSYEALPGTPKHERSCRFCGTSETKSCTFDFDETGYAECAVCGHTAEITISVNGLEYDGTDKAGSVSVTVVLDGDESKPLSRGTDYNYTVKPASLTDVGEFTVAVTGITYDGPTFTKEFCVTRAQPVLTWDDTVSSLNKNYDGKPVDEAALLRKVIITAPGADSLKQYVYFSYRKAGSSGYTDGLPTEAGTYQIKANLPETRNHYAASSADTPILTISKINPVKKSPTAAELTYNGIARELVTGGEVWDGAVILYALGGENTAPDDSAFSAGIPTATDAGDYFVWYKVEETNNYNAVGPTKIRVTIQRKRITPVVQLEYTSYVYTGGEIQPKATVRDPDTLTELPVNEYTVEYSNNISVGKKDAANPPTVTVKDVAGGNYDITETPVYFEITAKDQAGLTVTNLPGSVTYGDVFTLETTGGSGNGAVTWEIIDPASATKTATESVTDIARINIRSGQVTVTGVGTVTVRATKAGTDYAEATAEWTFTAEPKRVTATVTADSKTYDGNVNTTVHAVVEQGVVSGDTVTITGPSGAVLTGTFSTADAGANKTVTVNIGNAEIRVNGNVVTGTGAGGEKYIVTIPGTATADIYKAEAKIATPPTAAALTYDRSAQALLSSGAAAGFTTEVESTVSKPPVEYSRSKDGTYSTDIPTATDAGRYEVWYRVRESTNYTGVPAAMVEAVIKPKEITASASNITLDPSTSAYDGSAKEPSVTVKDGSHEIPASEYTVTYSNNVNAGTATVRITDNSGGNYTVNGSRTFTITRAKAEFAVLPAPRTLSYNGKAQPLITAGVPRGGTAVYSLDGTAYSPEIPTGTERNGYTVYAKVLGDANHEDSEPKEISVTIGVNNVTSLTVELSSTSFRYNGGEQKPTVTVKDDKGNVIPANEYTVTYEKVTSTGTESALPKDIGTYKIIIASKAGGNYSFTTAERTFTITPADQTALTITGKPGTVYYDDTIQLSATGGSGNGTVEWSVEPGGTGSAVIDSNGKLTIKGAGSITVKAARTSDSGNYEVAEDTWQFYAYPKPVTAVVKAEDKDYDGDNTVKGWSVTVPGTTVTIAEGAVTATFDDENAGTNKTVTFVIDITKITVANGGNFDVTYPTTTTASIRPVPTSLTGIKVEAPEDPLTYQAIPQELVTVTLDGITAVEGGDLAFSLDGRNYDLSIPTGLNAGTYHVRYKVLGDRNHTDSDVGTVEGVIIAKATPEIIEFPTAGDIKAGQELTDSKLTGGKVSFRGLDVPGVFTWTETSEGIGLEELGVNTLTGEVKFTPLDTNNYESVIATHDFEVNVTGSGSTGGNTGGGSSGDDDDVIDADGEDDDVIDDGPVSPGDGPSIVSSSPRAAVRNGTASAALSGAEGNKLVDQAVANQSENVVIKPEITGGVTKTEVTLPASAVDRLGRETDAALTVATPAADVILPNAALETLSGAGGSVSIATEQVENTVVLTLSADGREITDLPGGLTLMVPAEDAGPGTVAVLVHEDGTRETVRRSVAEDGLVRIPLNGSVTVEIVDNSKVFADIPAESREADVVAFVSARELFIGTGDGVFCPEMSMTRAMLANVLYNLEGRPDQELAGAFSDVSRDAWYAAGVLWAAANGVVGGYSDGRFGPDDSVTREQLAIMLWNYMGCPAADEKTLHFADADQVSNYAMEAVCWAAAKGILTDSGSGLLDPGGPVTRAEAAQLLKNFIENT